MSINGIPLIATNNLPCSKTSEGQNTLFYYTSDKNDTRRNVKNPFTIFILCLWFILYAFYLYINWEYDVPEILTGTNSSLKYVRKNF